MSTAPLSIRSCFLYWVPKKGGGVTFLPHIMTSNAYIFAILYHTYLNLVLFC